MGVRKQFLAVLRDVRPSDPTASPSGRRSDRLALLGQPLLYGRTLVAGEFRSLSDGSLSPKGGLSLVPHRMFGLHLSHSFSGRGFLVPSPTDRYELRHGLSAVFYKADTRYLLRTGLESGQHTDHRYNPLTQKKRSKLHIPPRWSAGHRSRHCRSLRILSVVWRSRIVLFLTKLLRTGHIVRSYAEHYFSRTDESADFIHRSVSAATHLAGNMQCFVSGPYPGNTDGSATIANG